VQRRLPAGVWGVPNSLVLPMSWDIRYESRHSNTLHTGDRRMTELVDYSGGFDPAFSRTS